MVVFSSIAVNESFRKISVDLGCGCSPRNPFNAEILFAVDIQDLSHQNYKKLRLGIDPLPFRDNEIDYFTAYDVLEHIPRILWRDGNLISPFIYLLSEIHRCLNKSGIFYAETPAYPHGIAFQDPTHVNIITEDTIYYFCENPNHEDLPQRRHLLGICQGYGFNGCFEFQEQSWRGAHLIWKLKNTNKV